ncbi:MAG: hypothetical protein KDB99_13535 [Chitinophagaceae bacterium]|nr:hypothetical protein [Chitinophagaceae bacterium]
MPQTRQLAAIMFADIVGYTAMMQHDEKKAFEKLQHFKDTLESIVPGFAGKIVQYYGDGSLMVFTNATDAVNCGKSLQENFRKEPGVPVRIGIHMGDILVDDNNIYGDSVNISSRIESMGVPGAVLISDAIRNQIKNKPEFALSSLGEFEFKNVVDAFEVYALANEGFPVPDRSELKGKFKEIKNTDLVEDMPKQKMLSAKKNRAWLYLLLLIVLAAGALFIFKRTGNSPGASNSSSNKSIAVLPFTDMSPEKNQGYLGDGLSEDIITALSGIEDLKVIGRTSSFQFKDSNIDLRAIGKALGVENVLEGSVQKAGNNLRVTAQLIRVSDGSHIWSEKWDRDMNDIFKVHDEISNGIKEKLQLTLTASDVEDRKIDAAAFENYLKGREALLTNEPGKVMKARDHFLFALGKEPEFAEAAALLSMTYYTLGETIYPYIETAKREKAIDSSMLFAKKAIAINDNNSPAHLAMAGVHKYNYDWINAEKEYRKAYAINPGTIENNYLSEFLANLGNFEEAIPLAKKALTSDPLDINTKINYAYIIMMNGQYDDAIKELRTAQQLDSNALKIYSTLGHCFMGKNQEKETLKAWAKQHEIYGNYDLANAYKNAPDFRTAMQAWMDQQKTENAPVFSGEFTNAIIYAYFKEKDNAISALELAYEHHAAYMIRLKAWKIFDFLRDDPKYKELYQKLGFDQYDAYRKSRAL